MYERNLMRTFICNQVAYKKPLACNYRHWLPKTEFAKSDAQILQIFFEIHLCPFMLESVLERMLAAKARISLLICAV